MGDIAEAFKVKLTGLNASSQSIETLSHWCVFHRKKAKDLVKVFERELQGAAGKRKLVFLYLANEHLLPLRRKYCGMRLPDAGKYSWRMLRVMSASENVTYVEYDPTWEFKAASDGSGLQWCV